MSKNVNRVMSLIRRLRVSDLPELARRLEIHIHSRTADGAAPAVPEKKRPPRPRRVVKDTRPRRAS